MEIIQMSQIQNLRQTVVEGVRRHIGKARYSLRSHSDDAPDVFNCSSFTQYVFRIYAGIIIPRRAYQQKEYGIFVENIMVADLIFVTGPSGYDKSSPVGHVGIATGLGKIIHATPKKGVAEDSFEEFMIRIEFLCSCDVLSVSHNSH